MGFPEDASLHGHVVDALFRLALALTGVAFVAVAAILVLFLVRYRERPGRRASYTHGESRRALGLTLALSAVVFVAIDVNLAIHDHRAWETLLGNPPDAAEAFRVQVMPKQFEWSLRYPGEDGAFGTEDDVTTVNLLHVPVNRPVLVELRSEDTIHSFFLPHFRIKQDALPGMTTRVHFQGVREGRYEIACAELCGLGHYRMRGFLIVESEEEVAAWLRKTRETYGADHEKWKAWEMEAAQG